MTNALRTLFICNEQFGSNFRRLRPQGCSQTPLARRGGQVVPKYQYFVNVYKGENVNSGMVGGQKSQNLVNEVCERPLIKNTKDKVNS